MQKTPYIYVVEGRGYMSQGLGVWQVVTYEWPGVTLTEDWSPPLTSIKKPPCFIPFKPPGSWWNSTWVEGCYFCQYKDENQPINISFYIISKCIKCGMIFLPCGLHSECHEIINRLPPQLGRRWTWIMELTCLMLASSSKFVVASPPRKAMGEGVVTPGFCPNVYICINFLTISLAGPI